MFKKGDVVVCILRDDKYLIFEKKYEIDNIVLKEYVTLKELVHLFSMDCFITLKEYRKQKLKKLCIVQNLK